MKRNLIILMIMLVSACGYGREFHTTTYQSLDGTSVLITNGYKSYLGPSDHPEGIKFLDEFGEVVHSISGKYLCKEYSGIILSGSKYDHFTCGGTEFKRRPRHDNSDNNMIYGAFCWSFYKGKCSLQRTSKHPVREISYELSKDHGIKKIYLAGYSNRNDNNTLVLKSGPPLFAR